ncbi:MAG: hypothetical protein ACR2G3_01970 [Solirubrobacterales bacterium]
MRLSRHAPAAIALAALALLPAPAPAGAKEISACAAATYRPAEQPPFGGLEVLPLESVRGESPPGHRPRADVVSIALRAEVVRAEEEEHPPGLVIHTYTRGECLWQVSFSAGGEEVARVTIDDRSGTVLEAWRDHQLGAELARGYGGAVAQAVNSPWVWISLCLLLVGAFFDPRRPFRLLHLDLLVLVGLSASLYFFNRGEIEASVALTYPVLGYVLLRMLHAGFRPVERAGPLWGWAPVRWLAIAAVLLGAGRIALNVADSRVIDVGVAGVIGADHITGGEALYEGEFAPGIDLRGDVYGPANYLAYVPFEAALPWEGEWGEVPAAHAAAIAFDLIVVAGLFALGGRLRPGPEGRSLGIALAFGWLACPWTLYAMNANVNDGLVAASVVWALVALRSAPGRGLALAIGAAAKFGTAALAPLFATVGGVRDRRGAALFTATFGLAMVLLFAPFLPGGGPSELYDRTLGYQADRGSPFSVWGLAPSLEPLQDVVRIGAVALALVLAFVPRTKSLLQVAALSAAIVVAVQLGATHWFYFYVVWFLPAYLAVALGEAGGPLRPSRSEARRAAAS